MRRTTVLLMAVPFLTAVSLVFGQPPRSGDREGGPPPFWGPPPFGERGGREGGPPPMPLVQALDANGDGEISAGEIENAVTALKTLDKDKNGKLTAEEFLPRFRGRGEGGRGEGGRGPGAEELVKQFMAFDKNGDGKLTRDELPERMQSLFDRADANKDGVIDNAELTAVATQQSGRNSGGRGGEFVERRGRFGDREREGERREGPEGQRLPPSPDNSK